MNLFIRIICLTFWFIIYSYCNFSLIQFHEIISFSFCFIRWMYCLEMRERERWKKKQIIKRKQTVITCYVVLLCTLWILVKQSFWLNWYCVYYWWCLKRQKERSFTSFRFIPNSKRKLKTDEQWKQVATHSFSISFYLVVSLWIISYPIVPDRVVSPRWRRKNSWKQMK